MKIALRFALFIGAFSALCGCTNGSLSLSVVLPPDVDPNLFSLTASIFAPENEVPCRDITFRTVSVSTLEGALVARQNLELEGIIEDIPVLGRKIVVVVGTNINGTSVVEGCVNIDESLDVAVEKTIVLEPTVILSIAPTSPAQLITNTGVPATGTAQLTVTHAFDGSPAAGVLVDVQNGDNLETVESDSEGRLDIEAFPAGPGPFQITAQARLAEGAPKEILGFALPTPVIYADFEGDAEQLGFLGQDAGDSLFAVLNADTASMRFARARGGEITLGDVITFENGVNPPETDLSIIGRVRMTETEGPSAVLASRTKILIRSEVDDRRFLPPDGGGVSAIPVGPCTDPDLAPLLITTRNGGTVDLLTIDGKTTHTLIGAPTVVAAPCASSPSLERLSIIRERRGDLFARSLGAGVTAPLIDNSVLPLGDRIGDAGALAYGAESPPGLLVVARLDQVQVRVGRFDPSTNVTTSGDLSLPGPATQVGSARLFNTETSSTFAIVSLNTGGIGGQANAILVIEGIGGLTAAAPLNLCVPAESCEVRADDVDGDGKDELLIGHQRANIDDPADAPRIEIWDFSP